MKKVFADMHLRLNVKDHAVTLRMIKKAAALGYHLIAVSFRPETPTYKIMELREACNKFEIDFAPRIDLQPRTRNELMHQLRKWRRKFEILCVICENKTVARQAAKDRRVDLLNFPFLDFRMRFFDRAEAELARNSLTALEIDVKPLLVLEGAARIRLLSNLRRETATAKKLNVPIVVSSGVSEEILLRKPRELAALAFLFGLDEISSLETVTHNPCTIVKRNRMKLSSNFVAPGIRLIKEGKDC